MTVSKIYLFNEQIIITKGGLGYSASSFKLPGKIIMGFHHMHTFAATTGGRLDEHRECQVLGCFDQLIIGRVELRNAVDQWDPGVAYMVFRTDFIAHDFQGMRIWANECNAGLLTGTCKFNVLRYEAVSGVHCLGACIVCCLIHGFRSILCYGRCCTLFSSMSS